MKYVVRGLDICTSPSHGNFYIWGYPRENMTCIAPTITHIVGSTELGIHVSGNGEVLEVAAGSTIMVQCTGHGDPAPSIQWSFPFATADEIVVEPNTNRTVLRTTSHYELKRIRLDQSGLYKCVAANIQGTTDAYIQVNVRPDMTLPHTPEPPFRFTITPTTRSISSHSKKTPEPPTPTPVPTITTKPDGASFKEPTPGGQIEDDSGSSDDKVKYTVVGVGIVVVFITLIVLIVVIVYVYKARQRAYQRTYDVQERLSELNYPTVQGMTNGEVVNGHAQLSRLDSEVSTRSTTPFGLSHA